MRSQSKKKSLKENGMKIRQVTVYEPDFKKAVASFAEEKGTSEAKKRFGVSDSCIRRWRKIENKQREIAKQSIQSDFQQGINKKLKKEIIEEGHNDITSNLDSMPLNQRLKVEQEPQLQSQPLSPTKLKVTRQSKLLQNLPKPEPVPQPPPPPPVEEISLKWNSYQSNMQSMFPHLLSKEQYVDATLVAEGQSIKCHRVILSSCSPYFEETLNGISPFQHPVIFMKDVPFWVLKTLCDFMYTGEVQIMQTKLEELLTVAENLKIKGLAEKENHCKEEEKTEPIQPIKQEKVEEIIETKEKEPERTEKREVKVRRTRSIPTHIPLLKCERLKLIHNSEKALLKRLKVQYKNSQKKSEPTPPKSIVKEPLSKTDILDPYDLLEPVYEEVQKETKPAPSCKVKESKTIPVKKTVSRKVKKRKISDVRDESPSPILTKKGTRSRPLNKMAKYSDTGPPNLTKEVESPIVHEPHTSHTDPLLALEDIKTEPLDIDENIIEIEDNVVGFSDNISLQEEDIISNYDNVVVNVKSSKKGRKVRKKSRGKVPKKPAQIDSPVLMEVHSLMEKDENILKIVNVTEIKGSEESRHSDFLEEDPLNISQNVESITITNVQSLVETKEDSLESMCNEMGFRISEIRSQTKESIGRKTVETEEGILGFEINQEEKIKETDKEKGINVESQSSTEDGWNVAFNSINENISLVDANIERDAGSTVLEQDDIFNESEIEIERIDKTTNNCDRDESETAAIEDKLQQNVTTENSVMEVASDTSKIDETTLNNDNVEHSVITQNKETAVIRVIAIEQLEIQSDDNETNKNTKLKILSTEESSENDDSEFHETNEDTAVTSVFLEAETNNLNRIKKNEELGQQLSETYSESCTQLEFEHSTNTGESDNVTFQYDLGYTDNSVEMPEYSFDTSNDGIPVIENQNKSVTSENSNYNIDNLNYEDASQECVEKTYTSNVDSLKDCEENISEIESEYCDLEDNPNIALKPTGSNEESCSQNITAYTSPDFHLTQVVSERDVNDDSYKFFKESENSYVESQLNENDDPMRSEIDTIVSDLTQIVGESQNSLSESNPDAIQEDIEESLANLLK